MLPPAFEPKRQNKWVLDWEGLDAWYLRTFARPNFNLNEVVVDYINTKRYFQGKFEWQTLQMVLNDPIIPSAAQKVMEWVRKGYENVTGRAGYKEAYTAKDFSIKMLDPTGVVVELWKFYNVFPTTVDFSALDYTNAEVATITITIRFDYAVLMY